MHDPVASRSRRVPIECILRIGSSDGGELTSASLLAQLNDMKRPAARRTRLSQICICAYSALCKHLELASVNYANFAVSARKSFADENFLEASKFIASPF
jgi:hypothetical protein